MIGMLKPICSAGLSLGMGKRSGLVRAEYQATLPKKEMSSSWCSIPITWAIFWAHSTSLLWLWPYRKVRAPRSSFSCRAYAVTVVESSPPERSVTP